MEGRRQDEEEDDPKEVKIAEKKRKVEYEPLEEGCWGEAAPKMVVVEGLQPYIPLPRRVGCRVRGSRAAAQQLHDLSRFISQDIRLFMRPKPRAVDFVPQNKPDVVKELPTFAENPAGREEEDEAKMNRCLNGTTGGGGGGKRQRTIT